MWDPFRPLHEREQLLVSCLADVSHWVVWLQRRGEMHGEGRWRHLPCERLLQPSLHSHSLPESTSAVHGMFLSWQSETTTNTPYQRQDFLRQSLTM